MTRTKNDLGLVLRAAQSAANKHKDQRRKDADARPYINHPINLAGVLYTDGGVHDPIVIAATQRSALVLIAASPRFDEDLPGRKQSDVF
jgi:predicted patatin/cPLA2 family phospholipase